LGSGIDGTVLDYVELGGEMIIGGRFRGAGGVLSRGIASWNGHQWSALGSGLDNDVHALSVFEGRLVAAGPYFGDPGGSITSRVQQFDGQHWSPLGVGMNGDVYDLIVFDGALIAAGYFTSANGVAVRNIARWTGSTWAPMGVQPLGLIEKLIVFNQQLIASGYEPTVGMSNDYNVVLWDGQAWQPMRTRPNFMMRALAVFNGELIAGGDVSADGESVFRWTGSGWSALPGLHQFVNALAIHKGKLVAAANSPDGDIPVSHWDGNKWRPIGDNFNFGVASIFVYRGQLLASGGFHRVGNLESPYLIAHGPAQTTQTGITSTTPSPSAPGQPVTISVQVTGVTAPTVGHVTLTGSPGGSCTDLTLATLDPTTSLAQCTIQWNTGCPRTLMANYVGGTDGTTTWQSSESAPVTHVVEGGVACAQANLFADGFE
jgi:hypothetical protein